MKSRAERYMDKVKRNFIRLVKDSRKEKSMVSLFYGFGKNSRICLLEVPTSEVLSIDDRVNNGMRTTININKDMTNYMINYYKKHIGGDDPQVNFFIVHKDRDILIQRRITKFLHKDESFKIKHELLFNFTESSGPNENHTVNPPRDIFKKKAYNKPYKSNNNKGYNKNYSKPYNKSYNKYNKEGR